MRITVVSQYFRPEPGATSNRLNTFVQALAARGHHVEVICEQPNHPAGVFHPGYGRRPLQIERDRDIVVRRLWVAASPTKTTIRRLAFYGSFAFGAAAAVGATRRPDVVFASTPPLPGVLGVAAAARARAIPLVVDVRDLWPAAAEALGELSNPRLLACFERAERALYKQAAAVTATTLPFCTHIDARAGWPASVHVPNGALDALVELPAAAPPPPDPFVVGYAGNLGLAQGLGIALDAAERLRDAPVRFVLLGDGPLKRELEADARRRELGNFEFRAGVPAEEVASFLQQCHALLVPLRDHPLLGDFIPSKLYDAMAVGRPALVALRGEGAALTTETGAGLVVPPEDGEALATAVRRLLEEGGLAERLGRAGTAAAPGFARSRQVDTLERVLTEGAGRCAA
jgi:glycosyltransferase involved in cell wall biosynthesis